MGFSLFSNATGSFNTATGAGALLSNTADNNTAFGAAALLFNSFGFNNTAIGIGTLRSNTTGSGNTAVGANALYLTAGSNNTALGAGAGGDVTTANNVICIGNEMLGANVSDSCYIGNIYGALIDPSNTVVGIDATGKLGTAPSARRFKRDIQLMENPRLGDGGMKAGQWCNAFRRSS